MIASGNFLDYEIMLSRNKLWTKEEDERLRAFVAQGASAVKVAAALKRKIVSVRTHARALGCPFPTSRGRRISTQSNPFKLNRNHTLRDLLPHQEEGDPNDGFYGEN
jgi:hypothetical protein